MIDDVAMKGIKKISAILPNNLYLGGSHALQKFFYETSLIDPCDIDLFYFGPRPMEKWVFQSFLENNNFTVVVAGYNYDGKYLIGNQYWYLKVVHEDFPSKEIDIIFVNIDPVFCYKICGSDFAGILYEINFGTIANKPSRISRAHVDNIKNGIVEYDSSRNTESQIKKVIERARIFDLKVIDTKANNEACFKLAEHQQYFTLCPRSSIGLSK